MRNFFRVVVFSLLLVSAGTLPCAQAAFHQGDQGEDIAAIQTQLNAMGYNVGSTDGEFGETTAKAIERYQKDKGLEVDGVIGVETYQSIMGKEMPVNRGDVVSRGDGATSLARRVVQSSLRYQGIPYVFGGTSTGGFDCSGFTRYVFAQVGIHLPRAADEQYEVGQHVSYSRLQAGDLVYFSTYEPGASHVGIYLGNGQFISATSSRGIAIATLESGYWGDRYIGARRVL